MRKCLCFFILFLFTGLSSSPWAAGAVHEPYILARVIVEKPGEMDRLGAMGLDIIRVEKGQYMEFVTHQDELERLRDQGYHIDVLIEDMEAYYSQGRKGDNFGPFHTYSETVDELDAIHAAYPQITTAKVSLGISHEGRDIWAIKVSDNPDVQEDEPEVLFDGLHHAREPITVEVLLNTMNHLCENYGADPYITSLVDDRQIWFVPIVNPDGYVYNESTNPSGGGMWRKNRRNNGGGSYGVDPNRNYTYQWGGAGSSGDPDDENYRGPYAGSEPEIQAMMNFIQDHQFVTQNSYHSVVGAILFPWSYTPTYCPEDALFRVIGTRMARDSGYEVGTVYDVLNYLASGGADDWSYGDTAAKPKIYSFSTEVAGSSFWPLNAEIPGLVYENLYSDLYLIQIAGIYLTCEGYFIVDDKGNGQVDPGESVLMTVTLRNDTPLCVASGVTATLSTSDSYVQLLDVLSDFGDIGADAEADNNADPLAFSVDTDCPPWHKIPFVLEIVADGGSVRATRDISVPVGQPAVLYANDFETASDWTQDDSHTAANGEFVRIDPNPTAYQPGADATPDPGVYAWVTGQNSNPGDYDVDQGISATRSPAIDLLSCSGADLSMMYFFGQRDQGDDPEGDFFRIDLSNDGGNTFPVNVITFGDVARDSSWHSLEVDLDQAIDLTDQVHIRVQVSEGPAKGDLVEGGIDDVFITTATDNTPPPPPVLNLPAPGDTVGTSRPILSVQNAIDPDGDPLTYGFRVYGDSLLTDLVASANGVASGSGTSSWQADPPLASEGSYWWRAFADDGTEWGIAAEPGSFTYFYSEPSPPVNLWAEKSGNCIVLMWSPVAEAASYVVYRDSVAGFEAGPEDSVSSTADTSWVDCDGLAAAYYLVRAVDGSGQKSEDSGQVGQFQEELLVVP